MSSLPPTNGSREQLIYYRSHSGGYSVNPVWLAACKTLASASSKEEGALHSVTLIPRHSWCDLGLRQRAHALACFRWTTIVSLLQLDVCGPSSYPSPSSLPSKHARNTRTSDMPPKKKPKHDPNQTTLNFAGGAAGV